MVRKFLLIIESCFCWIITVGCIANITAIVWTSSYMELLNDLTYLTASVMMIAIAFYTIKGAIRTKSFLVDTIRGRKVQ